MMRPMNLKPLQVFKPGSYIPMGWKKPLDVSEADLRQAAAVYDPALHRAPIVIGHPKLTDPAYGHMASFAFVDGFFEGVPENVDAEFADLVNGEAFPSLSVGWYLPNHPRNPVPGSFYPREVSFLGAVPPAVRGLRQPKFEAAFAAEDEGIARFGAWEDLTIARLFRSLKNWLIEQAGQEVADRVLDEWDLEALVREASREERDESAPGPAFAGHTPTGATMTPEEISALRAKAALADQLERALEQERAKTAAAAAATIRTDVASFAQGLISDGILLPKHRKLVEEILIDASTPQADGLAQFAGEDGATRPLADEVKAFLKGLPKVVEFSELATATTVHPEAGKPENPLVADADRRAAEQKGGK